MGKNPGSGSKFNVFGSKTLLLAFKTYPSVNYIWLNSTCDTGNLHMVGKCMCGGNMRGMPVVSLLLDSLPLPAVLSLLQVLAQLPGQVGAVGNKKIQQLRKLTNLYSKTFVYILQCSGAGGTEIILKIRSRNYLFN